ncbi:phosphoribosylglycinamide formyltransferase [Venturia nashicola]|nr:phosphoribosylglycinamide formyltransferase [Venturia nashicola]
MGISRAKAADIPVSYHNLLKYKRDSQYATGDDKAYRKAYDEDLAKLVLRDGPDLVVCAGFMHVLGPGFLGPLGDGGVGIINLHPALRAQYNGANAIERAHADFMEGKITKTGVMIHYVIDVVDMGDPILQIEVPLTHPEDDDIGVLKERIHGIEHGAIVEGTRLAIEKLWKDRKAS